jgi:hypothetical protein
LNEEALRKVLGRTLEDTAFIFTEPVEPSEWAEHPKIQASRLEYHGAPSGVMLLVVTPGFGVLLAANLLGMEPDDPGVAEGAIDAQKELLNIVGGVLQGEGLEATDLGIPEMVELTLEQLEEHRTNATLSVTLLADAEFPLDFLILEES